MSSTFIGWEAPVMRFTRRRVALLGAAAVVLLGGLAARGRSGAQPAGGSAGVEVGVASDRPIASYGHLTLTDLRRMAKAGQIELTTPGVSPATDTPSG